MQKDPISSNQPIFKLPYQDCKHHGQKLNYICLDQGCSQSSIICSICKDEKHSKHTTKPLKFYINDLEQKYHNVEDQFNLNDLLEELQVSEYTFCQQLKKTVENVAEQFQKLQKDVMQQIHTIRNEIFEQIAKRNRFGEFSDNLRKGRIQQSNFMIQNYLPQTSIGKIYNFEKIQTLSQKICSDISSLKKDLFSRQTLENHSKNFNKQLSKQTSQTFLNGSVFDIKMLMKTPPTITFTNSLLTQTIHFNGSKSLCFIDYLVTQISGKINLTVKKLNLNASVIISLMTKQIYESMKECWAEVKLKDKQSYAMGSNGYIFGWTKRTMTQFGQNSTLSLSCKSNQFRIDQKSKYCMGQLSPEKQYYIVLALMGDCQVKVKHKM